MYHNFNVKVITKKQAGNRETQRKDSKSRSTYNVRHIFQTCAETKFPLQNNRVSPRTYPVHESLLSNFEFRLHNGTAKLEQLTTSV
jgi:hypothetical protein